jgi:hypothetical protein
LKKEILPSHHDEGKKPEANKKTLVLRKPDVTLFVEYFGSN